MPSYEEKAMPGQNCLQKTFLRLADDSPLNFGLIVVAIVLIWLIVIIMYV